MTDHRLTTESAGRPWLKRGGQQGSRPACRVDCRERSTPAAEASLNQLPHASPGLLPLGRYCFNKPASAYLQAGTKACIARRNRLLSLRLWARRK